MGKQQDIEHSRLHINGLNLHIAQIGEGTHSVYLTILSIYIPIIVMAGQLGTVVFLHGFPEIWYSWRHQMIAVADAGFRALAPDFRGYGLSDQPIQPEPETTSWEDLIADLLAILDSLAIPKVFIVGKDFGAKSAYDFALRYPERVLGVITMGVPYLPKGLSFESLPEGFYILRWQEPGRAEADFSRLDIKTVVRNIYILFSQSNIPIAEECQEIMDLVDSSTPLPPWFSDEDLAAYGALYENSGFGYPLKVPYRLLTQTTFAGEAKVNLPALLIMGEADYFMKFPGMEDYVRKEEVKHFVPDLETIYVPEGTHFVQEQFPELVNKLVLDFLKNHI